VFCLLTLSTTMCAAAYGWWRSVGLSTPSSLLGLVLLSTSAAFALEIRGWEIDKLLEPTLFVLAALAVRHRRYTLFVVLAVLAAANAETGIFAPFLAVLAPPERKRWWAMAVALIVCAIAVLGLLSVAPPTHIPLWIDTGPNQLVNIAGGLCLLPVIALACGRSARNGMGWLLYGVVPVWVLFVLATHRLDQGAAFLGPLAVVWLPVTLLEAEAVIRASSPRLVSVGRPGERAG
jgi:hypothetical protein